MKRADYNSSFFGRSARNGFNKAWRRSGAVVCASLVLAFFCWSGWQAVSADSNSANIPTGSVPISVAVNPVTNKTYIANCGGPVCGSGGTGNGSVTVIDGRDNSVTTITNGTFPIAVGVNPVTNRIYVTNYGSANVTVIDGATNTVVTTIAAGTNPRSVAVNSVTNKIYVTNQGSANVTVIDGTNNTVTAPLRPAQLPGKWHSIQ